jgi:quercetin dioxygenase-like cupin family protein
LPAIRWISAAETPPVRVTDVADGDVVAKLSEAERLTSVRSFHPGQDGELQMFEVTVPPETVGEQHNHDADEILYVVEGQMRFGSRVLDPGDSVYIPGKTLYSFRSDPDGLRFLNFRATEDTSYFDHDAHMARRAGPGM